MPCIFSFFDALKMSEAPAARDKRLSTGARVSDSFGDFYENLDPNIKRRNGKEYLGLFKEPAAQESIGFYLIVAKLLNVFPTPFM